MNKDQENFIDPGQIWNMLNSEQQSAPSWNDILAKARAAKGLTPEEVAAFLRADDPELWEQVFAAARTVKERIYGNRVVIFAPLYLSNYCINHCAYCGYHSGSGIVRRKLTQEEIADEVRALEAMGHKRLAVELGEDPENSPLSYLLESLATIYRVRHERGNIRRVNVNIAATTVEEYRKLKTAGIGTYILFQETYHQPAYEKYHPKGPKSDYLWHLTAFDRAMEAGNDDVGAGILFGLYDYRFELIALLHHAAHLEATFGVGPHTVSVPRIRQACGVDPQTYQYLVSDEEFAKIIALIRLALPYTGIILSTRESPELRRRFLQLGVSQISAGSCTGVGGYHEKHKNPAENTSQFRVEDHRKPDEIYMELCQTGYLPSFCTACYRQGRTGDRFMELAKSGDIGRICTPNALLTFQEYLLDYASEETKTLGEDRIRETLDEMDDPQLRREIERKLEQIKQGERDLFY